MLQICCTLHPPASHWTSVGDTYTQNATSEHVILCALHSYFQKELFRAWTTSIMQDFHACRAMFSKTPKISDKSSSYSDFVSRSFKSSVLRHLFQSGNYAYQLSTLESLAKRRSVLFQDLLHPNHDFHPAFPWKSPENGSLWYRTRIECFYWIHKPQVDTWRWL